MAIPEVAKRLKVPQNRVVEWEQGQERPTVGVLEDLAKIYKRPLAAFFLPEPPQEPPLPTDFRTLPDKRRTPFSKSTRLAIRRAMRVRRLAVELAGDIHRELVARVGRLRLSDNPETASAQARRDLGVTVESQLAWENEMAALDQWKRAIEGRGVLVLQLSFPIGEARGFSLPEGQVPVIVLNARDSLTGRAFSLFHEYAHVLLGEGGICDMEDGAVPSASGEGMEVFCNRFAGALLVPGSALMAEIPPSSGRAEWSDEDLQELGSRFKVSREVILRRLVTIGKADRAFYERRHQAWQAETVERLRTRRYGRPSPPKKCLRENGTPFVSLALETHRQGRITHGDVSDYLRLKLSYLPQVERLIALKG